MSVSKLKKSALDKTIFLCECGNPVLEAFFDKYGYLHTAGMEKCSICGKQINEDYLNEDDIEIIR